MIEFVTVPLGRKNAVGDWIVVDRIEQRIVSETSCQQIVVTPGDRYNLTHFQTGFFLLGGFWNLPEALEAAARLAQLFPIDEWGTLAKIAGALVRPRIRAQWEKLPMKDKRWMERWGGPRAQ